jgi:hypothetical protein
MVKEVQETQEVHEGAGSCECCENGGFFSQGPGNVECGNCGHSYGSHSWAWLKEHLDNRLETIPLYIQASTVTLHFYLVLWSHVHSYFFKIKQRLFILLFEFSVSHFDFMPSTRADPQCARAWRYSTEKNRVTFAGSFFDQAVIRYWRSQHTPFLSEFLNEM